MARLAPLLLGIVVAACADTGTPEIATETDSAGVRIVTNSTLDVASWDVDPTPVVELGTVEEGGPEQFFRVSAARRLNSGEIAIHDGSREVRIFDRTGTWLRSFGREGDGPGEYRGPGRMFRLQGDTIAIFDTRLRRLTLLDDHGQVLRTISPNGIGRRPQILTVLPDGSSLHEEEIILGYNPAEYTQQYANYILYGPDGEVRDSLPVQPRVEVAVWGDGPMAGPRLFEEGTQVAGDWSGYWVGIASEPEIRRYSLSGSQEMLMRWPADPREIPADAAEIALEEALASLSSGIDPEPMTTMYRSREVPDLYPAHGPIMVDALDHLWVQRFESPGPRDTTEWRVFDPDGRLVANVVIPAGHRVMDIGEDYILAVGRDDFDVEYVRMFGLTRG